MTIPIAIIDPFIKSPAVNCFNRLTSLLNVPTSYHMPSLLGLESLTHTQDDSRAYIVLGSASHVHENLPWQKPLADFLMAELLQGKPVLGCCFGHQLMCHAFGAQVEFFAPDEEKLVGSRKIILSEDFWNFKKCEAFTLGVTHKQVVRNLTSELISVGHGLENDIVIHRTLPFLGTQAHPEASDSFCSNDINKDLDPDEKALIQKDGERLILRFFKHFELI